MSALRTEKALLTNRPPWRNLLGQVTYEEKATIFRLIGYEPHSGQVPIHESQERIRTVCCGRRFGKSKAAAAEAVVCSVLGGGTWAVAPDYELSSIVFDEAMSYVLNSELASQLAAEPRTARGRQQMIFKSGGWILGKSSHKPRSLLGRGLDLVIYDEAATEDNAEILHQYLRPVLIDRVGHLLNISTPRGDNWFKEVFDKGQFGVRGYASWQMPSHTNPHVAAKELLELVEDLPETYYRQEILAEFLENIGAFFRGYREVSVLTEMREGAPVGACALGVDLGRHEDYTVVCVLDIASGDEVYLERFNQMDWTVIEEKIRRVVERFPGPVLVDSTGVGDRSFRALEEIITGVPLEPFTFTNITKLNIMNQLQLAIQDKDVRFLGPAVKSDTGYELGKYAMGEMSSYRYERTPSGKLTLNAPPGKHDDVVAARALALECALRYGGMIARPKGTRTAEETMNTPMTPTEELRETFGSVGKVGPNLPGAARNFGKSSLSKRLGKGR